MCGEYLEAASLREREERESTKEMCGEYLEAASLREREERERVVRKCVESTWKLLL